MDVGGPELVVSPVVVISLFGPSRPRDLACSPGQVQHEPCDGLWRSGDGRDQVSDDPAARKPRTDGGLPG